MKKVTLFTSIALSCLILFSCSEKSITDDRFPTFEGDPAGFISYGKYTITSKIIYVATIIDGFKPHENNFVPTKIDKTNVSAFYVSRWEENILKVSIPEISVLGNPFDVFFNCVSSNAKVEFNDAIFAPVELSVKGWIKYPIKILQKTQAFHSTSSFEPYIPEYECEIEIDCILEEKPLKIIITSVKL